MKFIQTILYGLFIVLLGACRNDYAYEIEGEVSNLNNPTIYAIFEKEDAKWVDTVECKENGVFKIQHEAVDIQSVTLFFENKTCWTTIYPELHRTTVIEGDIRYPSLLKIKGSRINDQLTSLRKENKKILKEITDVENQFQTETRLGTKSDLSANLNTLDFQLREEIISYIQQNPKEEASIVLIEHYFSNPDDTRKMDELLAVLDPELSQHYLVKRLQQYSKRAKLTALGEVAPDFSVSDIYHDPLSLDSFPNKHVLLTFTAPWCDMCQSENIYLDKIVRSYSKDTIEMLLVSLCDSMDEVGLLLENDSIQWRLVTDSAGQAARLLDLYNVNVLPQSILIDDNKKIILKAETATEVKQTLEKLLKK